MNDHEGWTVTYQKNIFGSIFSYPLRILKTSITSPLNLIVNPEIRYIVSAGCPVLPPKCRPSQLYVEALKPFGQHDTDTLIFLQ